MEPLLVAGAELCPAGGRDRTDRVSLLAGSISKASGQFELATHLPDRRDDLLAHQLEAAHGVFVAHRPVAVPEEDLPRTQRFQHVADLGDDGLGRAGDDRVVFQLALVDLDPSRLDLFGRLLFGVSSSVGISGPLARPRDRRTWNSSPVGRIWVREVRPGRFWMKGFGRARLPSRKMLFGPSMNLRPVW